MTPEILEYLRNAKTIIGGYRNVLEIGSMNVNGSAKDALHHFSWLGVDIAEGPGVDVVLEEDNIAYESLSESGLIYPDTIVICECLEHTKYPIDIVSSAQYALRRSVEIARFNEIRDYDYLNQYMIITSPSYGFSYHAYPKDYWRFTKETLEDVLFDGMEIVDLRYLDSNEGKNTTVAGIARLSTSRKKRSVA